LHLLNRVRLRRQEQQARQLEEEEETPPTSLTRELQRLYSRLRRLRE
jgi:hypothetical protein